MTAAALGLCLYVIVGPLWVTRYPMMTDLPFHAANAAILRHYGDPAWHFREQFVLQPFAVPYLSMYLVAGALMTFTSAVTATKIAAGLMLAMLPLGLAVMFHGMKKSPLLGLTGLAFVWCGLSGWGFLNYLAALGLFAMVVGLTLRLLDRPSRARQVALSAALLLLFFTHVFRFPFAVAAVVGCALVMLPATGRWRPIVLPLIPPLLVFALWWLLRPPALSGGLGPMQIDWVRLDQAGGLLYHSVRDPAEGEAARRALALLGLVAASALALFAMQQRWRGRDRRAWYWGAGVTLIPLCCAAVFLWLFLALPMEIGLWWYVYPREITAAVYIALGALPDLPRQGWLKAPFVAAMALGVVPFGQIAIEHHGALDRATRDFTAIIERIPQAPKLCYLIFDHSGSAAVHPPFIHLPAYVQATRGGWLSFHFATWGAAPAVYRPRDEPGAVVPPPTPLRWEWTPHRFRLERHGAFFDWFLVRRRSAPDRLFAADPSIERVAHEGTWWLYRRKEAGSP